MKSNKLLKVLAFVLAAVMLICTAASAAGLVVCLVFGAYSEGEGALTRNLSDNILSDYIAHVENLIFDSPESLNKLLKDTGIQAQISAPDGSIFMVAGEQDASAGGHSLTVKCVYLDNYEYEVNHDSTQFYFIDVDGEMEPFSHTNNDIYYISPEQMKLLLEAGGKIVSPNPDIPVSPETLPSYPHKEDTYPSVDSETSHEDDVTDIPDTQIPDEEAEFYAYRQLEDSYVILSNGAYSPVFTSTKPVTKYYTGAYAYSEDGEFGWFGNLFPEEIERSAYTVKLTMTEHYHARGEYDYEYLLLDFCGENMYNFVWMTPLLLAATILLLIFLCSASGHTKNGIRGSIIEKIPFDVYLAICALVAFIPLFLDVEQLIYNASDIYAIGAVVGTMAVGYATLFIAVIMSVALRIKLGEIFTYTLCAMILKLLWKGAKLLCQATSYVCRNIGVLWTTVLCSAIFVIWTLALTVAASAYNFDGLGILLMIMGLIAFPAVFIYVGYQSNKINRGCKRIAGGDVDYKISTAYMTPNQKDLAETINGIGSGLSSALTERVKSERLKTELITNVSHDLKTPLTSIVNYTDLLSKEQSEPDPDSEKMGEYIEILCRQSARLKKLTEDLVEASKAATGNVESRPERLDISELLSQSVGEFADRFEAAGLTPVENKPQEPIHIFADGRHVWRIFENLLANTCKYSLAGTRVYIDLSADGTDVTISIKNISAHPLNVSADELTERFVRGDSSRHTEGSGLGLSIARSLAELEGGSLKIEIDGDCFKAYLKFRKV